MECFSCFLFSSGAPFIATQLTPPPPLLSMPRWVHVRAVFHTYGDDTVLAASVLSGVASVSPTSSPPSVHAGSLHKTNFLKTIRAEASSSCSSSSSASVFTAVAALFVYRSLVLVCHNSPVFTAHGPWQGRVIAIAFINVLKKIPQTFFLNPLRSILPLCLMSHLVRIYTPLGE